MLEIANRRRLNGLKVILAAALVFAQLTAGAHAHDEHSDHDEPDCHAQCAVCLLKSSSDDDEDRDITPADWLLVAVLDVASPVAAVGRSDPHGSPVRGRCTNRGPPLG